VAGYRERFGVCRTAIGDGNLLPSFRQYRLQRKLVTAEAYSAGNEELRESAGIVQGNLLDSQQVTRSSQYPRMSTPQSKGIHTFRKELTLE